MGAGGTLPAKIIEHPVHGALVDNLTCTEQECMIRLLENLLTVDNQEYRGSFDL